MAIIRAKIFRGYSSKPDDLINNLEFAQDCNDVVIHRGDICNLPYPKKLFSRESSEVNVGFLKTDIENKREWLRFDIGDTKIQFDDGDRRVNLVATLSGIEGKLNHPGLDLKFEEDSIKAILKGNILQLGNWLYINCNTFKHSTGNIFTSVQSRMLKITSSIKTVTNTTSIKLKYGLVGVDSPIKAVLFATASGSYSGSFDFAFTFVTNFKKIDNRSGDPNTEFAYYDNNVKLGPDDIESNAASIGTNVSYSNKLVQFRVTLPPFLDHLRFEGPIDTNPIIFGVYARASDEQFYRFVGYWPSSGKGLTGVQTHYFIDIDQTITQHIDRTPPLSGHSVPYNGTSMVFYKDRIYRNTSPFLYTFFDGTRLARLDVKSNLLQVSPSTELETINSPYSGVNPVKAEQDGYKIANYRDTVLSRTIGNDADAITGLIVYLGQLIIFKERETYHLTNDISVGSIRILWSDLGCVNIKGGRGFIVVENRLYFVAHDGVYVFSGEDRPVKISGAIEEDLLNITNYKYAILSVDYRYEHLYLTFLGESEKFIFHYGESGGWTKSTSAHEVLIDPDNEYYYNTPNNVQQLTKLDVSGTFSAGSIRNTFWKTGLLTLGDDIRNKKWNELTIETQTVLSSTKDLNIVIQDNLSVSLVVDSNNTAKRVHLGLYNSGIEIRIGFSGTFKTITPFRMNGMSITGEIRGRR